MLSVIFPCVRLGFIRSTQPTTILVQKVCLSQEFRLAVDSTPPAEGAAGSHRYRK